jgi:hypothetical protein
MKAIGVAPLRLLLDEFNKSFRNNPRQARQPAAWKS